MGNPNDFTITFKTKDEHLVMKRKANPDYYFTYHKPNIEFINLVLSKDACTKGVKVLSYSINNEGIQAVVEWLK